MGGRQDYEKPRLREDRQTNRNPVPAGLNRSTIGFASVIRDQIGLGLPVRDEHMGLTWPGTVSIGTENKFAAVPIEHGESVKRVVEGYPLQPCAFSG